MKTAIQNLIKLLLGLHKSLLDLEKEAYERKNGAITSNNEYFSLVVNHEDFKWLRSLSEIIALIDEEAELENINPEKIKELILSLNNLLATDNETEFSLRYRANLEKNEALRPQDDMVRREISRILESGN